MAVDKKTYRELVKQRRAALDQELRRIMAVDLTWMAGSGRPLLVTLYVEMKSRGLRPKCVVEYMRVPFVYSPGNVRVTILLLAAILITAGIR